MTELTIKTPYHASFSNPKKIQEDFIYPFKLKDPGSSITHFVGFAGAIIGTPLLLIRASLNGTSLTELISFTVFMMSMILLYGASTAYHSFDISEKANRILRKIDHMMIFLLIAGTYTPICMLAFDGRNLLLLVYAIAIIGILIKAFWITCPKWFSSVIYIAMGWVCVLAFPELYASLSTGAFLWLLAGGIIYTIGGIIYALKLPVFNTIHKNFGSHEIFHLFVMAGSFCHYMCIYLYLA